MTPDRATIVWVPGLLYTPAHYTPIIAALAALPDPIPSLSIPMPNYGPGAPSALPYDDLTLVRATCSDLVDAGKDVILIGHSYSGVPVCQAVRGLERSLRQKEGKAGGIVRVVFIAAFLLPDGMSTMQYSGGRLPPPWVTVDDGGVLWRPKRDLCMKLFFQDLPPAEQERWADELVVANSNNCTTPVRRACWDVDVAKTYVATTQDLGMPVERQRAMMKEVWDGSWSVDEIGSGHAPFLSKVAELVEILERYA